jgi:hypothetical protein
VGGSNNMLNRYEILRTGWQALRAGRLGIADFCLVALGIEAGLKKLIEPCSVAGHDSIPNASARTSGNLRGKEDVGLGDLKTERNMC